MHQTSIDILLDLCIVLYASNSMHLVCCGRGRGERGTGRDGGRGRRGCRDLIRDSGKEKAGAEAGEEPGAERWGKRQGLSQGQR